MPLSVVYPRIGATASPAIDIVAVHGLGGDALDTWTHPKSKKFWLGDFLPQQIPDARIMTFGYNADAAFGQSTADEMDIANSLLSSLVDERDAPEDVNRPLVFIAHSLGGIVVKQALFQAGLDSRYQPIRNSTLGLIFLGTPHRGSDKAIYGKVLVNVAQFMRNRPPDRLLSALQTNSEVLLRLTTNFRHQLPDYKVYSFYELHPMLGSSLVVEKRSALLEANHEEQIPVEADHRAMCKFETADDDTFKKIYMRVRRMRAEAAPPQLPVLHQRSVSSISHGSNRTSSHSPVTTVAIRTRPAPAAYTFDQLTPSMFNSPRSGAEYSAEHQWQRLTLIAWSIYDRIIGEMSPKDPDGRIPLHSFAANIPEGPLRTLVPHYWLLFDRPDDPVSLDHSFPRGYAMAVLFMLHLHRATGFPWTERISRERLWVLRRFTRWVPCACRPACGREWNYANDYGMHTTAHAGGRLPACRVLKDAARGGVGGGGSGSSSGWKKVFPPAVGSGGRRVEEKNREAWRVGNVV